ncbi:MAG: Fic family protein [Solirubrobacterales bacterium]
MAALTRAFSIQNQPEVFLSTAETSRAVRRAVDYGQARKIGSRLYTRNVAEPLEAVARRNWQRIAALYFPGAVVADRSAFEAMPSGDGSLFLDAGPSYSRRRPVQMPGLILRPRKGPGPIDGDMPFMEQLHFSSTGRRFLDNIRRSRARDGKAARTLSRAELEDELTRMAAIRGADSLNELRDEARLAAAPLDAAEEMAVLDGLIGAVLTTNAAQAHRLGLGFDPRRLRLFEALQARLLTSTPPGRPASPNSLPALSFIEAYFSNWIEGTRFELAQAEEIVFAGVVPEGRSEDAHDILGTFELVNDPRKRDEVPTESANLLELLRSHHALMLARRPAANPGAFKTKPNQAGGTNFVHPDLVEGTLIAGFDYYESLPAGLSRAIFMMFLISEVHPFTDGNGRVARVLMNADLTAVDLQRIVIPLCFRDDYMQGLRALSRNADPRPLVRILDYAQRYAVAIDWSDLPRAEQMLEETNAFVPPDLADERELRLELPAPATPRPEAQTKTRSMP